jgi:alanyl-tRNA synthetase
VPGLSRGDLDLLELAVNAILARALPISARWVTPEEFVTLPVRSRRLPEGHQGDLRLVAIGDVDLNTCGGTHVRSTADVGLVHLGATESIRDGTRVEFTAGRRLLRRITEHEHRCAQLRALLSTGDDELVGLVESRLAELRESMRRERALAAELAAAAAAALLAQDEVVVGTHLAARDAEHVLETAKRFQAGTRPQLGLIIGGDEGDAPFALVLAGGLEADLGRLCTIVCDTLGGKGGGRPPLARGKVSRRGQLAGEMDALRAALVDRA